MAKIETFVSGTAINVTASVGKNGVNMKDDVFVVQAMMKYALEERHYFRNWKFPAPTGVMTEYFIELIKEYQRYLRRKNKLSVSVDGVISRAVGDTAFGKKGVWTILSLNSDMLSMRLLRGGIGNVYQDICRRHSGLSAILEEIPVGDLELSLEPSGVGSLNLGLE